MTGRNYEKMKQAELKAELKAAGMTLAGDKGTQSWRLKQRDICVAKGLKTYDGTPIYKLLGSKLVKACAKEGVSCIGNNDEMLELLVTHMVEKSPDVAADSSSSTTSSSSGAAQASSTAKVDPIRVAKKVLELDENDDYESILNLATKPGDPRITSTTSHAIMRKAYLKLSLLIHPDRLSRTFGQATKAFQALAKSLERLSAPPIETLGDDSSGGRKGNTRTIARSNEGCKRTRVACPRCKQPWSERKLEGNPEYCYNFMMMGLKQYHCSTCLFEFGCMTAIHLCPHCKLEFEYSPSDYHRRITCGRKSCSEKPFGFYMYPTSDRVLTSLKAEVLAEHNERTKAKASKQRRAARGSARGGLGSADEEQAFMLGLTDSCPRCGLSFEDISNGERWTSETTHMHLMSCTDTEKQQANKAKKAAVVAKEAKKEKKMDLQHSVQGAATWQFLGGNSEQLYLLDDAALRQQAKQDNIDLGLGLGSASTGTGTGEGAGAEDFDRAEIISKLVKKGSGSGSGGTGEHQLILIENADGSRKKRRKISASLLPSNYHNMELSELRSVIASFGLLDTLPHKATKKDILDLIDGEVYDGKSVEEQTLMMITDGSGIDKDDKENTDTDTDKGRRRKSGVTMTREGGSDGDDEEDEYVPEEEDREGEEEETRSGNCTGTGTGKGKKRSRVIATEGKQRKRDTGDVVKIEKKGRGREDEDEDEDCQIVDSYSPPQNMTMTSQGAMSCIDLTDSSDTVDTHQMLMQAMEEIMARAVVECQDLSKMTFGALKVNLGNMYRAKDIEENKPVLKQIAIRLIKAQMSERK